MAVHHLVCDDLILAPLELGRPRLISPALSDQGRAAQLRLIAELLPSDLVALGCAQALEAAARGYDKRTKDKRKLQKALEHIEGCGRALPRNRKSNHKIIAAAAKEAGLTEPYLRRKLKERGDID